MLAPKIKENRSWTIESVRRMCIHNNLYTRGDNDAYSAMLNYVRGKKPTVNSMYVVAKDICEHSEDQTVSNVMFMLANEAVAYTFEIEGQDDI